LGTWTELKASDWRSLKFERSKSWSMKKDVLRVTVFASRCYGIFNVVPLSSSASHQCSHHFTLIGLQNFQMLMIASAAIFNHGNQFAAVFYWFASDTITFHFSLLLNWNWNEVFKQIHVFQLLSFQEKESWS